MAVQSRPYAYHTNPGIAPISNQLLDLPLEKVHAFQRACLGDEAAAVLGDRFGIEPVFAGLTRQLFQRAIPTERTLLDLAERAPWAAGSFDSTRDNLARRHSEIRNATRKSAHCLASHLAKVLPWCHPDGMPLAKAAAVMRLASDLVPRSSWIVEISRLPTHLTAKDAPLLVLKQLGSGRKPPTVRVAADLAEEEMINVRLFAPTQAWPTRGEDVTKLATIVAFQVAAGFARWFSIPCAGDSK